MAVYKVPQDVEAEDKLLGPLTFKQFIFLMVAAGATMLAWLLFSIQPLLALIPVPIIFIFGGLAVFRREDQPVERYLLSFFNFTLRPRTRIWSTEGHYEHLIITAPKKKAPPALKKNVNEVHGQLEKLAQIVDTRGWALKRPELVNPDGTTTTAEVDSERLFMPETPQEPDEVHDREDIMDENNPEVMQLDSMLKQMSNQQREQILQKVRQEAASPKPQEKPEAPKYDPYGSGMSHQHRINPDGSTRNIHAPQESSQPQPAPESLPKEAQPTYNQSDIMNLSSELKVSQIADKVNRDQDQKLQEGEEIKLR